MPELPEVETIKVGLSRLLPGRVIADVKYDWPKGFPNSKLDVNKFLVGAKVTIIRRRAKVLMIDLSSGYSLVIHLKMTGQLVFRGQKTFGAGHPNDSLIGKLPDKSTRVIITFEKGIADGLGTNARKKRSAEQNVQAVHSVSTAASDEAVDQERWRSFGLRPKAGQRGPQLFFNDQRKFGWMRLMPTTEIPNIDFMQKVGPEPLDDNFTPQDFIERLRKRKNSNIKAALLDQTVIAGVGNIYADESLFASKIHPASIVSAIPKAKLKDLYVSLRDVLELSIKNGGSTDRNYVNAEGKKGSYLDFAKVFRKENLLCPVCGHAIIKIRVAGRGTHVCPNCQKLYNKDAKGRILDAEKSKGKSK